MSQCLSIDEATSLASSVLTSPGVEAFQVRTDGPLAYPSDQKEAVLDHVSQGCVVYSGSGNSSEGTSVVYLSDGTG